MSCWHGYMGVVLSNFGTFMGHKSAYCIRILAIFMYWFGCKLPFLAEFQWFGILMPGYIPIHPFPEKWIWSGKLKSCMDPMYFKLFGGTPYQIPGWVPPPPPHTYMFLWLSIRRMHSFIHARYSRSECIDEQKQIMDIISSYHGHRGMHRVLWTTMRGNPYLREHSCW